MKENQCVPLDLEAVGRLTEAYQDLLNVKVDQLIDLKMVLGSMVDEMGIMAIFLQWTFARMSITS